MKGKDMKNAGRITFTVFAICLLMACTKQTDSQNTIFNYFDIVSVNQNINVFNDEAKKWDNDFYLAMIEILFGTMRSGMLNLVYESPNKDQVALSIWQYSDGTIESEQILRSNINRQNEITISDQFVDSKDIFETAIQDKKVLGFIINKDICGIMKLDKTIIKNEQLKWLLIFRECEDPLKYFKIEVDAINREIFFPE